MFIKINMYVFHNKNEKNNKYKKKTCTKIMTK